MGKRTRVTLTDARIAKLKPTASNPQPKLWDARTHGLLVRGVSKSVISGIVPARMIKKRAGVANG